MSSWNQSVIKSFLKSAIISAVVISLLSSCKLLPSKKSKNSQTNTNYPVTKKSSVAQVGVNPQDITGLYSGIYNCKDRTTKFSLNLTSTQSGQLSGTIIRTDMIFDRRNKKTDISSSVAGQYNAVSGSFNMTITVGPGYQRRYLAREKINGLFQPDGLRFIAKRTDHYGKPCSFFAAVKDDELPSEWDYLDDEAIPFRAGGTLGPFDKIALGFYSRSNRNGNKCDSRIINWIKHAQSNGLNSGNYNQLETKRKMYGDTSFKPFFGESFYQLSKLDRAKLGLQLDSSCQRNAEYQKLIKGYGGVFASLFTTSHHFTNIDKSLAAIAYNEILQWQQGAKNSLHLMLQNNSDPYVVPEIIGQVNSYLDFLWTKDKSSFVSYAYQQQNKLIMANLEVMFQDDLKNEIKTIQNLNYLALFPKRAKSKFRGLSDATLLTFKQRLTKIINNNFIGVAKKYIAEQTGMPGVVNLDGWTISYPSIASLLSQSNYKKMTSFVSSHRENLVSNILDKELKNYTVSIINKGNNLGTVKASIAFEHYLNQNFGQILDTDGFVQFAGSRKKHRKKIMVGASDSLVKLIKKIPHQTAVEKFTATYLLPEDRNNSLTKNIFTALEKRIGLIAPFSGQKISFYLNAVYSYDYDRLRQSDSEFFSGASSAAKLLTPGMDVIGILAEAISGGIIKSKNFSKSFTDRVDNQSIISPLVAVYLLEYDQYYSQCYEKPVKMRTREQWYTKTTQGGIEINREYDAPIIKEYLVNEKFVDIFKEVGLTKVNNSTQNMFELFLKGSGKLYMQDVVSGTRSMMNTYKCKSKLKRKIENNMIRYFNDYNSRIKAARLRMFSK